MTVIEQLQRAYDLIINYYGTCQAYTKEINEAEQLYDKLIGKARFGAVYISDMPISLSGTTSIFALQSHEINGRFTKMFLSDNLQHLVEFVRLHNIQAECFCETNDESSIIDYFATNYHKIVNHKYATRLIELLSSLQPENLELVKQLLHGDTTPTITD